MSGQVAFFAPRSYDAAMTMAFDTLSYAKKLESAGFTHEQARAQAEALAEIVSDNLATKADIAALQRDMKEMETSLRREIKELEVKLTREIRELDAKIAAMADKLTIRLGGIVVVGIAVLAALVKLL